MMHRRSFLQSTLVAGVVAGFSKAAPSTDALPKKYALSPEEKALIDRIPFKRVEVNGTEALLEWQRIRNLEQGWPVVIGGDEDLARIADQLFFDDAAKPADVLLAAAAMQHPASLTKLRAAEDARWKDYVKANPGKGLEDVEEDGSPPVGDWPKSPPDEVGLTTAVDILSGRPIGTVHILILPTKNGYEAPAYLNWGNWNECPPPAVHVAALRKWNEVYGAELIGMSGDVLNLRVADKPATREAALALAAEQYMYCVDIVDQGVGDLASLASGLMNSNWWYFWWD